MDALNDWKMELLIEAHAETHGKPVEEVAYFDLFPEENENDYETILDEILEAMGAEPDYATAVYEANLTYKERTGIDREANARGQA